MGGIAEGESQLGIPCFRDRKYFFYFFKFRISYDTGTYAVDVSIEIHCPYSDADIYACPRGFPSFRAENDKSGGLFAFFRLSQLFGEGGGKMEARLDFPHCFRGFYKDIAERLPIHGAVCDTGIFQKFIKYFFRNLFLLETAICAAADAKCMEVHGTGLI